MSFNELILWCQNHPGTPVARLLELTRQIAELEAASDEDTQEKLASLWTEIEDLASKDDAS
ncbi:MAG: hypothetical protein J0I20_00775 [Chloroflexi bacterium]|nr:hypothetical protein [Chloroflexota bacterium]